MWVPSEVQCLSLLLIGEQVLPSAALNSLEGVGNGRGAGEVPKAIEGPLGRLLIVEAVWPSAGQEQKARPPFAALDWGGGFRA